MTMRKKIKEVEKVIVKTPEQKKKFKEQLKKLDALDEFDETDLKSNIDTKASLIEHLENVKVKNEDLTDTQANKKAKYAEQNKKFDKRDSKCYPIGANDINNIDSIKF